MTTNFDRPTAAASLMLENDRLRSELSARRAELRALHERVAEVADAARKEIERSLHDGAQQRLVSLAMSLSRLEAKLPDEPEVAKPIARQARQVLAVTLAELRDLSNGFYPIVLAERGLAAAVEDLATQAMLPVRVDLSIDPGLPHHIEAAAYFVVSEALTNTLKHSQACQVNIAARRAGGLVTVEVSDDGVGGAIAGGGSGLLGLADRVEALGGTFILSSAHGQGTTVTAEIPCAQPPPGGSAIARPRTP